METYRKLSEASSQRYLPDIATGLGTLGTVLLGLKEYRKAEEAFSKGAELVRPFAQESPQNPHTKLLNPLESDLQRAQEAQS